MSILEIHHPRAKAAPPGRHRPAPGAVGKPAPARLPTGWERAFTMVEVLLAIGIFALVLTAIYSSWTAILRGSKAGLDAAAAVQRARIAVRAIEDALLTTEMFAANPQHYWFVADTSGEFAALSLVSRLPESFPGSGMYGEQMVRHVEFTVENGEFSRNQLMLRQWPLLMPTNAQNPAYTIVLGRDVDKFKLEFWDTVKKDWVEEWTHTNLLPPIVRVAVGMGNGNDVPVQERELVTRVIALPAIVVPREWQMPMSPVAPRLPGLNPTNPAMPLNPNDPRLRGGFRGGAVPGMGPGGYPQRPPTF